LAAGTWAPGAPNIAVRFAAEGAAVAGAIAGTEAFTAPNIIVLLESFAPVFAGSVGSPVTRMVLFADASAPGIGAWNAGAGAGGAVAALAVKT
jgi:hypothetical protein